MRRDGTFHGAASAADPSYQDDLEEFDAEIDDCMQVCQSASSRGTYMRTWRLWVAFNVLNLGLCMRSAWRIYDTDPGSQTRRRDERDVTRFAMLLAKRFRNSNTAAQGISMLRTVHKVRSGQALCPPQEAHQLSATLRGLSDMFPSVPRDRFPVTVQYIEKWSTMYRWRSRELINIFGAASSACSSAYCEQPKPSASTKPSTRQQTSAEHTWSSAQSTKRRRTTA